MVLLKKVVGKAQSEKQSLGKEGSFKSSVSYSYGDHMFFI